jgi:hypothetical protein
MISGDSSMRDRKSVQSQKSTSSIMMYCDEDYEELSRSALRLFVREP